MKSQLQIKILVNISILFFMFIITTTLLSQDLFTHFNEGQISKNQQTILKRLKSDSSTIDLQIVKVNTNYFKNSNSINLNLFSNKNYIAVKHKIEIKSDSDYSWFGTIPEKYSDIIISTHGDAVVGYMVIENECYNIKPLGGGLNVIIHADPSKYPTCGNSLDPVNYSQNICECEKSTEYRLIIKDINPEVTVEKFKTTNIIVRVLVAYTTNAKNEIGCVNAMNALITNSIASANDAYLNSAIPIELELAHRIQVDHNETNNTNSFY